ncbi:hypothetical protein JXB12_08940 [candidate division KSB1 bacterium]|nr:hypothetical protein [candidate division KSB1 bacterium]
MVIKKRKSYIRDILRSSLFLTAPVWRSSSVPLSSEEEQSLSWISYQEKDV